MKKIISLTILFAFSILIGCGGPGSSETEGEKTEQQEGLEDENTKDIPKADFVGVVNPVSESSYDEIYEIDGINMPIPPMLTCY